MKIVNVIGGLGNQMFQYAFAVALKARCPYEKVYVDTQHYKNAFIKVYHGNNWVTSKSVWIRHRSSLV